jgi:hypothetical protein
MSRLRRYARELLLAAGSICGVLLVLGAIELLLRAANPDYLLDRPQAGLALLHRYSEAYGWEPRPGSVARIDGQQTTINARGFRGAEHPPQRRTSRRRLLMLGDSIAFGYGVNDGATFSALLEARGFEVVNLAVAGYGTDQSLLRLQREGMAYSPDVVLLHLCLHNDFVDNVSHTFFYDGLHPKPYFTLEQGTLRLHDRHLHLSPFSRVSLALHERSHVFNRLVGHPVPEGTVWAARRDNALGDAAAAGELTAGLVARVAEVARAGGAGFLLLTYPGRREYRERSRWLGMLREAPALREVRLLDMGEELRARGQRLPDLTLDGIGHLNSLGHRYAADVMETALRTEPGR